MSSTTDPDLPDGVSGRGAQSAAERLSAATNRDLAARARDISSDRRDASADAKDALAPADETARERELRADAARDRREAADDRLRAALDREQAMFDRDAFMQALEEAHIDGLTGAYRRSIGTSILEAEIERARRHDGRLVIAFVDVDDLRGHNDRGGHRAGDELLADVGRRIRAHLRPYDPVVRFGGDEFVCALTEVDLAHAEARFAVLAESLATRKPAASVSVGFAELEPGDNLENLLARGDAALYDAKARRGSG